MTNSISRSSRRLSRRAYRVARAANTFSAITSGSPKRAFRRGKNIAVGRALGRAMGPIWRWPR